MDDAMPRAGGIGELTTEFRNVPRTTNPIGVKGGGEFGAIGGDHMSAYRGKQTWPA